MRNRITAFLILFALWLGLTWSVSVEEILAGAVFAALTVFLAETLYGKNAKIVNPLKYLWFVPYGAMLAWDITRSAANALYRLVRPNDGAQPMLLEVKTSLRDDAALAVISATASFLPGVVSAGMEGGQLKVYSFDARKETYASVIELALYRYENILKKVYG